MGRTSSGALPDGKVLAAEGQLPALVLLGGQLAHFQLRPQLDDHPAPPASGALTTSSLHLDIARHEALMQHPSIRM